MNGNIIAQGKVCEECKINAITESCAMCPFDQIVVADKCVCNHTNTELINDTCVVDAISSDYQVVGELGYLLECQSDITVNLFKLITYSTFTKTGVFKDTECNIKKCYFKGHC